MSRTTLAMAGFSAIVLVGSLLMRDGPLAAQGKKEGAEARKETEPSKINTSGTATVRAEPNRARLFLAIETDAPTVKQARAANKQAVEKVLAAIEDLKIPELKMKSTNVQMNAVHAKTDKSTDLPEIIGYRVYYTFTVLISTEDRIKLAAAAGKVLDTALEKGANSLEQVVFFRDDLTEFKRQALTKATEDAVANAKALAAGAKRAVIDVIAIDDHPAYTYTSVSNTAVGGADERRELIVGNLEVTCNVRITATFGP
jgi:uncharacterized protein YggE